MGALFLKRISPSHLGEKLFCKVKCTQTPQSKELKLGELYVLTHCHSLSSSMVLHLGELAKGQEGETSAQRARARMHGKERDVPHNTQTKNEQEGSETRCYSRFCTGVQSPPVRSSRIKPVHVRHCESSLPTKPCLSQGKCHTAAVQVPWDLAFGAAHTHRWETLGTYGDYPGKLNVCL